MLGSNQLITVLQTAAVPSRPRPSIGIQQINNPGRNQRSTLALDGYLTLLVVWVVRLAIGDVALIFETLAIAVGDKTEMEFYRGEDVHAVVAVDALAAPRGFEPTISGVRVQRPTVGRGGRGRKDWDRTNDARLFRPPLYY